MSEIEKYKQRKAKGWALVPEYENKVNIPNRPGVTRDTSFVGNYEEMYHQGPPRPKREPVEVPKTHLPQGVTGYHFDMVLDAMQRYQDNSSESYGSDKPAIREDDVEDILRSLTDRMDILRDKIMFNGIDNQKRVTLEGQLIGLKQAFTIIDHALEEMYYRRSNMRRPQAEELFHVLTTWIEDLPKSPKKRKPPVPKLGRKKNGKARR